MNAVAAAPAIYCLTIPDWLPPSLNALMRGTIKKRIRKSRECHDLVKAYALKSGIPHATGKRRVKVILTYGGKRPFMDVDAAFKGLLDALVQARMLTGDSYADCELQPIAMERAERSHTTILLEDME